MLGMFDEARSMATSIEEFARQLSSRTIHALALQPWHQRQHQRVLSHFKIAIRFPNTSKWNEYEKGTVIVLLIKPLHFFQLC